MLRFVFTSIDGSEAEPKSPVHITLNRDELVPADSVSVTYLYSGLPRFDFVKVYDGGALIFCGPVDEQQTIIDEDRAYERITARSMAAFLLDNESKPVCYNSPGESVIFSSHAEPYGFKSFKGDRRALKEVFNVSKGSTEWQAIRTFCKRAYGAFPRVESDGTLNFKGLGRGEKLLFSNTKGIAYDSLKENYKSCELISDIFVKTSQSGGYISGVTDKNAKIMGVCRKRYLDATLPGNSLNTARLMLKNARRCSYELTAECASALPDILGCRAEVEDEYIGKREGLYVGALYYRFTPAGEFTTVTLKKEDAADVDT